jgi:glycosyltransferase involved in cell wall biosynthesis
MLKNRILVSIVVPVFRVEKYLDECVQSLIDQTYDYTEIILVDDGSDDGCPGKCDSWARRDTRIRSFHKKNGGLSSARNYGIQYARGDYILFVDSDDFLQKDALDQCVRTLGTAKCETIIFTYWIIGENGDNRRLDAESETFPKNVACTNLEALRYLCEDRYENYVWRIFFPLSLWKRNDISFPEGRLFEDIHTTFLIVGASDNIFFLNKRLYNYRSREKSITDTPNLRQLLEMSDAYTERNNEIAHRYPCLAVLANAQLYKLQYRIATNEDYRKAADPGICSAVMKAENYLISHTPDRRVLKLFSSFQKVTLFLLRAKIFRLVEPFFYKLRTIVRRIRFNNFN